MCKIGGVCKELRERAYRAVFMGYESLDRDAIKIVASYRNIRRKRMYTSNSNFIIQNKHRIEAGGTIFLYPNISRVLPSPAPPRVATINENEREDHHHYYHHCTLYTSTSFPPISYPASCHSVTPFPHYPSPSVNVRWSAARPPTFHTTIISILSTPSKLPFKLWSKMQQPCPVRMVLVCIHQPLVTVKCISCITVRNVSPLSLICPRDELTT